MVTICKGNLYVRRQFCEFAHAASRTMSVFKSKHQSLVIRRGYKRAIIAIGHKILCTHLFMHKRREHYRDSASGSLFINDGLTDLSAAGVFIRQKDASGNELNIWKRTLPDNSILTLTHNSPWTLVMEDGSTLQLGESQDDFLLNCIQT